MPVNLSVVGGFVAAQITPQEEARHQQHNPTHDQGQAETGIAGRLLASEDLSPKRVTEGAVSGFDFRRFSRFGFSA